MIGRGASHDAQAFDDAWSSKRRRPSTGDVAELVEAAELLCRSAVAAPSPDFTAALRERLMAEAGDVLVVPATPALRLVEPAPTPVREPRRRRWAGLAAAVVTGVGAVGMVSSSAGAVPGDVLYPVKRGVESVQLVMHRDDASRGEYQLQQASERLAEAWFLDSTGDDARLAETLDDFSTQAAAGSTRLFDAYQADAADERIEAVSDFAAASGVTLAAMSDDLPGDAQAALDAASSTVAGLVSQASSLCAACDVVGVGSLVDAVEDAADDQAPTDTSPAPSNDGTPAAPAPAPTSRPAAPGTPAPGSVVPAPAAPRPSPTAPRLTDLTDPLLGGLLGDEDSEGLVPGLLDGLLGGSKK